MCNSTIKLLLLLIFYQLGACTFFPFEWPKILKQDNNSNGIVLVADFQNVQNIRNTINKAALILVKVENIFD